MAMTATSLRTKDIVQPKPSGSCFSNILFTLPFFVCVFFLATGMPNMQYFKAQEVHDPLLKVFETLGWNKQFLTDTGQTKSGKAEGDRQMLENRPAFTTEPEVTSGSSLAGLTKSSKEIMAREVLKHGVLKEYKQVKTKVVSPAAVVLDDRHMKLADWTAIPVRESSVDQPAQIAELQESNGHNLDSQAETLEKPRSSDVSEDLYRCLDSARDEKGAWPIAEWTWKQNDKNPSLSESTIAIASKEKGKYCWEAGQEFTWDDAVARLKGKHLIIFGDSVTRYQYMSLVYFLENKKWPDVPFCEERKVCSKFYPKDKNDEFCDENGVTNDMWTHFYKLTSKYLKHEKMECFRHGARTTGNVVENRYFRMDDVSVTFFRYTKHGDDFHGTWKIVDKYPWFDEGGYNCPVCDCPMTEDRWRIELNDTNPFAEMMKKLHPTHVVFNMGFWGPPARPTPDDFKSLFHTAKLMPKTKFIWKTMTCTKSRRTHNCDDQCYEEIKTFREEGFLIYDAYRLSSMVKHLPTNWTNLYFDAFHFRTPVYSRLNEILLSIIF